MEPLDHDPLFVAATRPALFLGLPLGLVAVMLVLVGLIIVLIQNPLYELMVVPLWFGSRELVRYDYNAVRVAGLWLRSKARALDAALWGGSSPATFPIKPRAGRGMHDAG